jgi:hypothetical protein
MNKPQLITRQEGQLYLAEFNKSRIEDVPKHIYKATPDFRDYVITSGNAPALRLEGTAAIKPRQYSITERLQETDRWQALNVGHIHHDIYLAAQKLAGQEGFEYFGLIVATSHPSKPVDADKDPYDLSDTIRIGKEVYSSNSKNEPKAICLLLKKEFNEREKSLPPIKQDWVLHPTVQLYVRG